MNLGRGKKRLIFLGLQQPRMDQTEFRSLTLHPGLPLGWQGLEDLSCLPGAPARSWSGNRKRQDRNTSTRDVNRPRGLIHWVAQPNLVWSLPLPPTSGCQSRVEFGIHSPCDQVFFPFISWESHKQNNFLVHVSCAISFPNVEESWKTCYGGSCLAEWL